jgi:hypothetical protein
VRIRTRLLLLVFAVWLPAMAGFGMLAWSHYEHETEAATERLLDVARSISFVVDSELDQRAAIAHTLGSARSLKDGEFERFYDHAQRATEGSGMPKGSRVLRTWRAAGFPRRRCWPTTPSSRT